MTTVDATRLRAGRSFKFSGAVPRGDRLFGAREDPGSIIAPTRVPIPGGLYVPQYAPTVVGAADTFDPAGDCDGSFMSAKFQANNNCYNYACDVATNSFAQPGRKEGVILDTITGDQVARGAVQDGLIPISRQPLSEASLVEKSKQLPPGHYVALLISEPDPQLQWTGDFHWVRRDKDGTWSQKDGADQITNFDFAGRPITDPASACWVVNQGPMLSDSADDVVVNYKFYSIMYVPDGQANII